MGYSQACLTSALFTAILVLFSVSVSAEDRYIETIKDQVNIRTAPSMDSTVVARSRKGDVFRLIADKGEWYRIAMFSGTDRYLYKSMAQMTTYIESIPGKKETHKIIYQAIDDAEYRALKEVSESDVVDINKILEHEKLLNDRYLLNVFHFFDLQPPCYEKILVKGFNLK